MTKTAVILAAGRGNRLGMRKPKGFLNIAGKPLIEHSLEALADHGITRFVVGTGYKAEYYENYKKFNLETAHNPVYERNGSLQTLLYCHNELEIDEDILLLDSDILYEPWCVGKLLSEPRPDLILLGNEKSQQDCVYVDSNLNMSKLKKEVPYPVGVLVGITKISRETWHQVGEYAGTPAAWGQHHDWAFTHTKNRFGILLIHDLIFTEIDNDEQLSYALNVVYPKL